MNTNLIFIEVLDLKDYSVWRVEWCKSNEGVVLWWFIDPGKRMCFSFRVIFCC